MLTVPCDGDVAVVCLKQRPSIDAVPAVLDP
jgi:hypothetical protein